MAYTESSFGASIGFGFGASVAVIADNKFVFAFTIEDVANYENSKDKISKAKKKGYSVSFSSFEDKDGYTNVYAKMQKNIKKWKNQNKNSNFVDTKAR